ncbi:MAG: class I SAM-dependent methyltransferase [Gemmatimonadaceae bacterium]|nr:class I SAM-dependent methyltransferase [Gemmatimonadaceae bacterium]
MTTGAFHEPDAAVARLMLDETLQGASELIALGAESDALALLVDRLWRVRADAEASDWRAAASGIRRHPVMRPLLEDPYLDGALHKPRGYPGDAATLDFVYRRRPLADTVSATGRRVHAVTTGVQIADAVRTRCRAMAAEIARVAAARPTARVVSVGCGHMRELHDVPPPLLATVELVGIDQDVHSLEALAALHHRRVRPLATAVRDLVASRARVPDADLIYVSGLFDYLPDPVAQMLTVTLARALRPGGCLLIANLAPVNEEIAFMEAITDWWMIYRDRWQMSTLTHGLDGEGFDAEVGEIADGRVAVLRVERRE